MREILETAVRAPSSFNFEPWRAVVVSSPEGRERLASAMVAMNVERVRQAPVSVVLLADLEAMRDADNVVRREQEAGRPAAYTDSLAVKASLFAGGALGRAGDALRLGAAAAAAAVSGVAVPTPQPAEAWASKHAGIAAGYILLAAASKGLASSVMEGLDGARVRAAVGAPHRFGVTMVISLGYAPGTEGDVSARPVSGARARRPVGETVSSERLGTPLPGGTDGDERA